MFKSWFAKGESKACRRTKFRFKSIFAKGENKACRRGINFGHTSSTCRPDLQLGVP